MLKVITTFHLSNYNTHAKLLNSTNINKVWQQPNGKTFTVRPPVECRVSSAHLFIAFFARYLYPFFEGWPLIDRETTGKRLCSHMCRPRSRRNTAYVCRWYHWWHLLMSSEVLMRSEVTNSDTTIGQWHQEQDDILQIREPGEPPVDPLRQSGFRWAQIRSLPLLPEDFHDAHAESQWRR